MFYFRSARRYHGDMTGGMGLLWYFFIIISLGLIVTFGGVADSCGINHRLCSGGFVVGTLIFLGIFNKTIFKGYGVEHISWICGIIVTYLLFLLLKFLT